MIQNKGKSMTKNYNLDDIILDQVMSTDFTILQMYDEYAFFEYGEKDNKGNLKTILRVSWMATAGGMQFAVRQGINGSSIGYFPVHNIDDLRTCLMVNISRALRSREEFNKKFNREDNTQYDFTFYSEFEEKSPFSETNMMKRFADSEQ